MRFHSRTAIDAHYNGLALNDAKGERIARAMASADIAFLANHGVVVCGERVDYAYDDLHYQAQVLDLSTGVGLAPVDPGLARRRWRGRCRGEGAVGSVF